MTDIKVVAPANMGRGIKWNPTTKQYEVDIVDLTPINNRISGLSNEIDDLKNRPDIVDLTPINNRISGLSNEIDDLKNRPDRDTIYDDTVLKNELASLRDLVNSTQNANSKVKYFKMPLSVFPYSKEQSRVMVNDYTINENINNIQAIEGRGFITSSKYGIGVAFDLFLKYKVSSGTSILVQSITDDYRYVSNPTDDQYAFDKAHALITLHLK